jgi:hypothetical protein
LYWARIGIELFKGAMISHPVDRLGLFAILVNGVAACPNRLHHPPLLARPSLLAIRLPPPFSSLFSQLRLRVDGPSMEMSPKDFVRRAG